MLSKPRTELAALFYFFVFRRLNFLLAGNRITIVLPHKALSAPASSASSGMEIVASMKLYLFFLPEKCNVCTCIYYLRKLHGNVGLNESAFIFLALRKYDARTCSHYSRKLYVFRALKTCLSADKI